jgi:transposase-like protein
VLTTLKETSDEHPDGRRHQALDGQAQDRTGPGHHQGQTTVSEVSRAFDLNPSEVEQWLDEGKRGMENALRSKPLEVKEQYEKQLGELQQAYGEFMLELRARKKLASLLGSEDKK